MTKKIEIVNIIETNNDKQIKIKKTVKNICNIISLN